MLSGKYHNKNSSVVATSNTKKGNQNKPEYIFVKYPIRWITSNVIVCVCVYDTYKYYDLYISAAGNHYFLRLGTHNDFMKI